MNLPEIIKNMDWDLLKSQKNTLFTVIDNIDNITQKEHLEGLIMFIDSIQDYAVDVVGYPEEDVFDISN